jgi:hypothetical protein
VKLDSETIYFVDSDNDPTVLLAIGARRSGNDVEWFDTVRDRMIIATSIDERPESVRVVSERAKYEFTPLTLELYNLRVRARVDGRPSFGSTEELLQFYREFPR